MKENIIEIKNFKNFSKENFTNETKFIIPYSSNILTLDELDEVVTFINSITNKIKLYELSDYEKVMYTYNFVKNMDVIIDDTNIKSAQNIEEVIKNKVAVCRGFSNIFLAILNNLDINCDKIDIEFDEYGEHERNIVYISDSKYDIDGLYIFDILCDSKAKNNKIDNFDFFALTLDNINKKDSYLFGRKKYCGGKYDFDSLEYNGNDSYMLAVKNTTINSLKKLLNKDSEKLNIANILSCFDNKIETNPDLYLNREIPASTFFNCLNKIYEIYNIDVDVIDIVNRTYGTNYSDNELDNRKRNK